MSYRDDHEALVQRVASLERELAQVRQDGDAAKAELVQLRAERAEEVEAEEVDDTEVAPTPTTALVPIADPERTWAPRIAAGAAAVGWTALALAVGASVWMLPAVALSVVGAARLARLGRHPNVLARSWPALPIDAAAYRDLLALPRRTVVVRVSVTFERTPTRNERERIKQKVRGLGPVTWDQGVMTIASGTLRTSKRADGTGGEAAFDPEVIRTYCASVFDRLVVVHEEHAIAKVWPRARSR